MTLPPSYARTLLIRASLLLGFSSFLLFSMQIVQRPSNPTNQAGPAVTHQQSSSPIILEQTVPITTYGQSTATEPAQSSQPPLSTATSPQPVPNPGPTPRSTSSDSTSASVVCVNSTCSNLSVTTTPGFSPANSPEAQHQCNSCGQAPFTTAQPEDYTCPTTSCAR